MIKSMTGFGRCEHQLGTRKFTVEMKGVNHRYLDVNIRMPKKLNFFETSIRSLLKTYASRGKVDIFITYEDTSESQVSLKYNAALAGEYVRYFKQMEEEFQIRNDLCASVLARCPEVLRRTLERVKGSSCRSIFAVCGDADSGGDALENGYSGEAFRNGTAGRTD